MDQNKNYGKINTRLEALIVEAEVDQAALERGEMTPEAAAARQIHRRIALDNIKLYLQWEVPSPLRVRQGRGEGR